MNIRILVVDDEESIRELLEIMLRREDYYVDSAPNGKEAMKKMVKHHYDVIISDIQMPEMDGISLLEELKKKYPKYSDAKREDIKRHITPEEINSNELHEVANPSIGCMLMKREGSDKVRFGRYERIGKEGTGDDIYFLDNIIFLDIPKIFSKLDSLLLVDESNAFKSLFFFLTIR